MKKMKKLVPLLLVVAVMLTGIICVQASTETYYDKVILGRGMHVTLVTGKKDDGNDNSPYHYSIKSQDQVSGATGLQYKVWVDANNGMGQVTNQYTAVPGSYNYMTYTAIPGKDAPLSGRASTTSLFSDNLYASGVYNFK